MQILDVYTKKEYDCPICKEKIYYAKIADEKGALVTTDGKQPNGKYGKDSNVLSGAVDVNVKDRLHRCTAGKIEDRYNSLVSPNLSTVEAKTSPTVKVRWTQVPDKLSDNQSDLYHGYHELTTVAYMLTKEQHPNLSDESDTFGMIVHAKSLVLSNMLIAKAIKNQKCN